MQNRQNTQSKVLIVGLGVSGLWTARCLAGQGANVTVSEKRSESELDAGICSELRSLGVTLEAGGHKRETFLKAEMIILSPGVPHDMDLIQASLKRGVSVTGELELAGRLIDIPIIAVTGTNGKSTVTAFLGAMLENAGFKVFVGGNIGIPLMAYAASQEKADYAVVEVSSFQLDTVETFCPFISIVLNISPDHLDRYADYEDYIRSKLRVFKNQGPAGYVILNDDDETLSRVNPGPGVSVFRYGLRKEKGRHAFMDGETVISCVNGIESELFSIPSFFLPGRHNRENLLAAVLCGMVVGIEPSVIQKTAGEFKGLPNRLEFVKELNGVAFYNDSKATNVDASVRSVMSFERPVILIAGGRHKGADYAPLVGAAKPRVKQAVFLGESRDLLAGAFEGVLPYSMAGDMEQAVATAFSMAKSGDVVLLAPACSSFDMFLDYSHRGRVFRTCVEELVRG